MRFTHRRLERRSELRVKQMRGTRKKRDRTILQPRSSKRDLWNCNIKLEHARNSRRCEGNRMILGSVLRVRISDQGASTHQETSVTRTGHTEKSQKNYGHFFTIGAESASTLELPAFRRSVGSRENFLAVRQVPPPSPRCPQQNVAHSASRWLILE